MTVFYLACAGLILLSGLFYLFPRRDVRPEKEDLAGANLEWYRLRRAELEGEEAEALRADAELRLLEDTAQGDAAASRRPAAATFRAWLLLPLVALASAALYHALGAAPDVLIARQLDDLEAGRGAPDMEDLVASIRSRSEQRPGNLHYLALLGRYNMGRENYAAALENYAALLEAVPQDAQALAYAAQAEYLATGRRLTEGARLKAERALSINPHQRTALGLLGMASYEQGNYRAAAAYWERLLAMEPPGSESARMLEGVLAQARQRFEPGEEVAATGAPAAQAGESPGVTVRVRLPEDASVAPGDTVFVLARDAAGDSRMPVAVERLSGSQLPVTLRLDDSNSMAGRKLSTIAAVVVEAQVSPSGRPGAQNASWTGRAGPLAPSAGGDPVDLVLAPR